MKYRLEYRPEAFADVAEAFLWYESQRSGLGDEFENEVGATIGLVTATPEAAPIVLGHLRRALVNRFPFAIYYTIEGEVIELRGVLHTSRDPDEWHRRA